MQSISTMQTEIIKPKSGNIKNMVIFLHGYGSNKDDLISIGHEWKEVIPDTVFISPNAPEPCEMAFGDGYQWFSLRSVDVKQIEMENYFSEAVKTLNAFIDAKLNEYGVEEENLVVVGFSQGAMMTMYTMPRRNKACAGIIGYSGLMLDAEGLKGDGINRMPVLAMHGEDDDVVPPFNLELIGNAFEVAGFNVETIMRPNLGHGIDYFGLSRGADFIKECFSK